MAGQDKRLPMSMEEKTKRIRPAGKVIASLAAGKVCSNDDLLMEILLRLPVKSVVCFKSVSKRWLSLITNPCFSRLFCSRNPNPNPPSGLFLPCPDNRFKYDFVPLDPKNPIKKPPFTTLDFDPRAVGSIEILQSSANGLLLCHIMHRYFYVYNPTLNQFNLLPPIKKWKPKRFQGMSIAVDISKSPHNYRVISVRIIEMDELRGPGDLYQVQIYSSETGKWKVSGEPYYGEETIFRNGVYCNDAVHWMQYDYGILYLKLSEEVIHYLDCPSPSIDDDEDFYPYDYLVQSPYDYLVESHGRLLLVFSCSKNLFVYELNKDYSGWTNRYLINLHQVITTFPQMVIPNKWINHSLVVGEKEEDSFFILEFPGEALRYDIASKTFHKLCDHAPTSFGSHISKPGCFSFIPSLAETKDYNSADSKPSSSVIEVASSDDLLLEILLQLSARSLVQLKIISKHWYSLITNTHSTLCRSANVDPPSGLFLQLPFSTIIYDFVPLDVENPIDMPPFRTLSFDPDASCRIEILQSCKGLLLCHSEYVKFYVYNPTTRLYSTLPRLDDWNPRDFCGMTLAFDPSRSSHYKVICVRCLGYDENERNVIVQVVVYSSETNCWRFSGEPFRDEGYTDFNHGLYCNDAVHWMEESWATWFWYFKFDEARRYCIFIDGHVIPQGQEHYDFLVESRDGLPLVVIFCRYVQQLDVYEAKKDYSGLSLKYHVDLDEVITVLPERRRLSSYRFSILSLVVGEREEDTFFVLGIAGESIRYNFLSKTFHKLCFGPFSYSSSSFVHYNSFLFIPSLCGV